MTEQREIVARTLHHTSLGWMETLWVDAFEARQFTRLDNQFRKAKKSPTRYFELDTAGEWIETEPKEPDYEF